jgi:hypothetical protein
MILFLVKLLILVSTVHLEKLATFREFMLVMITKTIIGVITMESSFTSVERLAMEDMVLHGICKEELELSNGPSMRIKKLR